MIGYKMHWLLEMEDAYLFLVTDQRKESCTVMMTAVKPKKVSRSIELDIDPENTFLMCENKTGGIHWKKPVVPRRDDTGKLRVDLTDVLRQEGVPFSFCPPGRLRHYKARTYELWDSMNVFDWGYMKAWDGFALESTSGASLAFFPGSCHICGAEIRGITMTGFEWPREKLAQYVKAMHAPVRVDAQSACRCLEEQGPLAKLYISGSRIRIAVHMFFLTSFQVEGFGRSWKYGIGRSMFQDNGCAPCKTHRFGPLLCRLLEAADEEEIGRALNWGVEEQILQEPV